MRTAKVELIEGYSRDELILMLSKVRRQFNRPPMSVPTFYRWCDQLSITPKYRYSDEDYKRLTLICCHYSQGGSLTNLPLSNLLNTQGES